MLYSHLVVIKSYIGSSSLKEASKKVFSTRNYHIPESNLAEKENMGMEHKKRRPCGQNIREKDCANYTSG